MSESPIGPFDECRTTGTCGTAQRSVTTCCMTAYGCPPEFCVTSDAAAKEEKRKADHAHNLRMQKARKDGRISF